MTTGSPLALLIQSALDKHEPRPWTLADLARETGLAYNSLRAWVKPDGLRSLPRPENLDKVAAALRLPADQVRRAAQEAAGYRIAPAGADAELERFLDSYRAMPEEDRAKLLRLAERLATDPDLFPRRRGE